jgi:hypothetical protein
VTAAGRRSVAIFDVGGVLLSNAWDREQRQRTLQHFALDEGEFDDRHDMLVSSLERGKIFQAGKGGADHSVDTQYLPEERDPIRLLFVELAGAGIAAHLDQRGVSPR